MKAFGLFNKIKQTYFFFLKKKNQNGCLKKRSFSSSANSQYFFVKILWIGPWVSRIDWCEGHWCGLTYMVVRLSGISPNTAQKHQKCNFCLFLSLCRTASQPYRLNHVNALCINQSYKPKDQSIKISQKNIENWRSWKMIFFFSKNFFFFASSY